MSSLYTSEQDKEAILALYDQKLEDLAIDYRCEVIDTDFGKTHIIITGKATDPALMVIHGSNGCAPIALETYINLTKHFQVFAIDVLAQPNKSAETRLSMKDDSYGQWMGELITHLGLKDITLAGFSFGGLVILKTLLHDESRIKEVFLSAPAYIVNGNPLKALFQVFIPMKRYIKTQNQKFIEKFLASLFSDRDEFAIQYLSKVFQYFTMDFTPVPVISKQAAQSIQTPITLFAAGDDLMFPGEKMIKRAKKIFPSLKQALLLVDSKHVQGRHDNEKIEKVILRSL